MPDLRRKRPEQKINIRGYVEELRISGPPRSSPRHKTAKGRQTEASEVATAAWVREQGGGLLTEEIVAFFQAHWRASGTDPDYYVLKHVVCSKACSSWCSKFLRRHNLRYAVVQPKFQRTKNGENLVDCIKDSWAAFYRLRAAIASSTKGKAIIHVGNFDQTYTRRAAPKRVVVDGNFRDACAGGGQIRLEYDRCESGIGVFIWSLDNFAVPPMVQVKGVRKTMQQV